MFERGGEGKVPPQLFRAAISIWGGTFLVSTGTCEFYSIRSTVANFMSIDE